MKKKAKTHGIKMPTDKVHNQKAGDRSKDIEASGYNKVDKKKTNAKEAKKVGAQKAEHYGASRKRRSR